MANRIFDDADIQNIANAIREKNGSSNTYLVSEMGDAIRDIPIPEPNIVPLEVTENGTYEVKNESGTIGFNKELKFKDVITAEDIEAYIASGATGGEQNGFTYYTLYTRKGGSPIVLMTTQVESGLGFALQFQDDGWIYVSDSLVSLLQGSQPGWNSFAIGDSGLIIGPISGTPVTTFDGTETFSVSLEAMSPFFDLVGEKIDGYSPITVNVPIPEGYIKPEGEVEITENGPVDVTQYESAVVNVPSKEPNLAPLEVTENGTYKASEMGGGGTETIAYNQDFEDFAKNINGMYVYTFDADLPPIDATTFDLSPYRTGWSYKYTTNGADFDIKAEDLPVTVVNNVVVGLMFQGVVAFGDTDGSHSFLIFSPPNVEELLAAVGVPEQDIPAFMMMYPPNTITIMDRKVFGDTTYEAVFTHNFASAGEPIDGFSEVVVNVPAVGFYTTEENESGGLTYRFSAEKSDVVEFNIAYGDTEPTDTSKLWVKTTKPSVVKVSSDVETEMSDDSSCVTTGQSIKVSMASMAQVGNNCYFFSPDDKTSIIRYNLTTDAKTTLGATAPRVRHSCAVSIGTKIFVFGGTYSGCKNIVSLFDTETETITTLSATIPVATSNMCGVAYGKLIYLFGGETSTNVYTNSVYCFDTETETFTTPTSLPYTAGDITGILSNKTIYLFGGKETVNNGRNTILKFDCETGLITTSPTQLPYKRCGSSVACLKNEVLLFGGGTYNERFYSNKILLFNLKTESITEITVQLVNYRQDVSFCGVVDETTFKIFGGYNQSGNTVTAIEQFTYGEIILLSSDTLQILPTPDKNIFNLINTDNMQVEIGVMSVLKGNADNIGEQVEAALHNGTSWVTI